MFSFYCFFFISGIQHINFKCAGTIFDLQGTALFYAAKSWLPSKAVRLLLDHGARVDIDNPLDFLYVFGCGQEANEIRKNSARDFEVARMLVQRGARLNLTTNLGARAFLWLLNRVYNPPAVNERVEGAMRMLTYLFQENAIKFLDEYGTEIGINLSKEWLDYPSLKYTLYLHQLGCNIEAIYDLMRAICQYHECPLEIPVKPGCLEMQCRAKIRKLLGCPLSAKVDRLPIPQFYKGYLCMKEIDNDTRVNFVTYVEAMIT